MTRGIDIGRRDLAIAGTKAVVPQVLEPRAKSGRLRRLKADFTINLQNVRGGDLRAASARGKIVESKGLHSLAGSKLSGNRGVE